MLLKACGNPPTQKYGKWMLRVLGERSMGKSTQKINKFSYEYDFFNNRAEVNKNKN